jgi:excisionase family DNA binding protein
MAVSDLDLLTVDQAAERLGLTSRYVLVLLQSGKLAGLRTGDGWRARAGAVERRASEADRWLSYVAAAKVVGSSPATIGNAVKAGRLEHRTGASRYFASIGRASVERFAREWQDEQAAARDRRAARVAAISGPPQDGQVWLDTNTTALVLGVSHSRVGQLARRERLPCVKRGRRRWFRRDHVEVIAAARAVNEHPA